MIIQRANESILTNFRPHEDDLMEALADGVNWRDSLKNALLHENTLMITEGDDVIAVGGNNGDHCWFVTSELVDSLSPRKKLRFRKLICNHRDSLLEVHEKLWNYVYEFNMNHIRFMKTIGAEFHNEYSTSQITGKRFQLFTIRRP